MGKTGPPFRFILSQTSAGKRDNVIALSLISVSFLCSCREAVPSSRPACCAGHRAQGPSRLAVAVASVLAPEAERSPPESPQVVVSFGIDFSPATYPLRFRFFSPP